MKKITAYCCNCHAEHFTSEMIASSSAKRGGKPIYTCERCASTNQYYHATPKATTTTPKMNALKVGIELETSYTSDQARAALFQYDMIATHDCSLISDCSVDESHRYGYDDGNTCEYVSPTMNGLKQVSKLCLSVDKLMQNNDLRINDSCGTHFHVSINGMKSADGEDYMNYIRRFYHSLFVPLTQTIESDPVKASAFFGRYFNSHYAQRITRASYTGDRYNYINVTNCNRIEFRLNKFTSGKQYQNLINCEVEMVKCIITNFCEHFNDTPKDKRRYPDTSDATMKAYRKAKADLTAKKLVKIYEKYTKEI